MAKYKNQRKATIYEESYKELFEKRNVDFLTIRRTITFEDLENVRIEVGNSRLWRPGDSLYKLSYEFYGRIDYWWTIALVNNKPTDAHFKFGDEVKIPADPTILNNLLESRNG